MIKRRSRNAGGRMLQISAWSTGLSRVPRIPRLASRRQRRGRPSGKIRYAVVGVGHIAQQAVLPAFRNATGNSELAALVSGDATKLKEIGRQYKVPLLASYQQYDSLLRSGKIDAVYIAGPNSTHRDFAVRAARAGVHVLCEKPLAVTEKECNAIIQECRRNRVKLMTAYRLHFEEANLEAIRIVQSGRLGEPRFFNSVFSMQAAQGNIRLKKRLGGGPLYDLGVYCINAARNLFRSEPLDARGLTASGADRRFREVEEMAGAILHFPGSRMATFICSFGASDTADCEVVGTKGRMRLRNAYEYAQPIEMQLTVNGRTETKTFGRRDQFAPELIYFSDCILKNKEPEPSGVEGLNDVRIIQAIHRSAAQGKAVRLTGMKKDPWPAPSQEIRRPPVREPRKVRTQTPSRD